MTDQVYSMGQNRNKESGHDGQKVLVPTLVSILEILEIVQVASGYDMTIFLTSEGVGGGGVKLDKRNVRDKPLKEMFLR